MPAQDACYVTPIMRHLFICTAALPLRRRVDLVHLDDGEESALGIADQGEATRSGDVDGAVLD